MTDYHGGIHNDESSDYLYRLSLKAVIRNDRGEVLAVKESGRDWWGLPGGGIDHGETITEGLRRELFEEIGLTGDFTSKIISFAETATPVERINVLQHRLVFEVLTNQTVFEAGEDADEVQFVSPTELREYNHDFVGLKEYFAQD